jgi:cysteinyl-tRNA synthetase
MCIDIYVCLQTLHECESLLNQHDQTVRKDSIPSDTLSIIDNLYDVFLTSMSDDLHTPVVLAGLSDPLKLINDLLHTRKVLYFLTCKDMGLNVLI